MYRLNIAIGYNKLLLETTQLNIGERPSEIQTRDPIV
jgi:hypothetical protein